ncbi:AbrB family transcriptional regulator [Nodosilinea sp. AN01ver1]|uniref:AbrB family transcriptional regulator n=1 Tax=Nodosilinea sp. AN01ver1 TaxID=3423362 RepID=UPI003D31C312
MANATQVQPLVGKELLQKVKDLDDLSKEDKAKACGYYTLTKSGSPRVNMMKFLNALIEAEGIQLDSSQNGNGRGGRSASFRITVQSNGNLLIGSTYTKQMGLRPGDEFEITLGRKHIRLKQLGESGTLLEDDDE